MAAMIFSVPPQFVATLDVDIIEIHPVRTQQGNGPLLNQTRALALELPSDYSTNFETRL